MLIKSFEITYITRCMIPMATNGQKVSCTRLLITILLLTKKLQKKKTNPKHSTDEDLDK